MRFLGITREPVFSPGRVEDDAMILEMAAAELRRLGHTVAVCSGDDDAWPEPIDGAVVFTMCQGRRALRRLQEWQSRGVRIINSPEGILNCQRHRTIAAFAAAGVAFPESILLETAVAAELPAWIGNGGAWLKRGDVHATEADDVIRVQDAAAAQHALRRFQARGIRRVVLQRHVPGRVVKFYAVRGRFFHGVLSPAAGANSAGLAEHIDALGQQAARTLGVEVYGGDCVSEANGRLQLIDLNDWPSYAPCRAEAAAAIAAYLQAQEVASKG